MQPLIGQIIMFAGTFAPRGWALCDGQLLRIERYQPLFTLIGTAYGGDGRATFALPDLRGRVPLHAGAGPGLTPRRLGEEIGTETVTLSQDEIPAHGHELLAANSPGDTERPSNAMLAQGGCYATGTAPPLPLAALAAATISTCGGGQPHENMPPALCVNFLIAIEGQYPLRE